MGANFSELQEYDTLVNRLKHFRDTVPNKELMIFYEGKERKPYTAQQLYNLGGRFAWKLHQHGFRRGDIIANTLPNSPERLITDIGIIMAGCIAMNGQVLLADGADLFQISRQTRCGTIIVIPSSNSPAWRLLKPYISDVTSALTSGFRCEHMPEMTKAIIITRDEKSPVAPLLKDLESSEDFYCDPDISADEIAVVHCTSGTTGYSKLVDRTHRELIKGYESFSELCLELRPVEDSDIVYNDRPFGWAGGFPYGLYCHGDVRVLTDQWNSSGFLSGEDMWNIIRREKCDGGFVLSMDVSAILAYLDQSDDQEAKEYKFSWLVTGGQPVFKSLLRKYLAISNNLINLYASTEMLCVSVGMISNDNIDDIEDYFCGKIDKNVQVRIVNSNGEDCGINENGELWAKGPSVFRGYCNRLPDADPKMTNPKTSDGFFKSGDHVCIDSEDNLYVKGRGTDIIMYGCHVLYPGWLEQRILTHPGVQAACVVPVPDPDLFHEICACVKPKDGHTITEEQLKEFCDSFFLTKCEDTPCPRYFMVLTDDFPQTNSGKNDRKTIREKAAQRFGVYQ